MPGPTTVIRGDTIRRVRQRGRGDGDAGQAGIDYDDVVYQLEHDGLTTFQASWAALTETLQCKLAVTRRRRQK